MNTQVEFRSSKFPPYDGEEEQINPGLWGKRLGEYLAQHLSAKGFKTEEIVAEDWGYYLPIQNEGEIAVLYCFAFLFIAAEGGGMWSVDALRSNGPAKPN